MLGNRYLYLGTYPTEEEAAVAYDEAALKYRGPKAVTNFERSTYKDLVGELKKQQQQDQQVSGLSGDDVSGAAVASTTVLHVPRSSSKAVAMGVGVPLLKSQAISRGSGSGGGLFYTCKQSGGGGGVGVGNTSSDMLVAPLEGAVLVRRDTAESLDSSTFGLARSWLDLPLSGEVSTSGSA